MTYKRILVAVDGNPTSERALREALNLAKDQQAELRLVHVVDDSVLFRYGAPVTNIDPILDSLRQGGQDILNQAQALARQEGHEATAELLETRGQRVDEAIVGAAKSWPADLLVMGTHGRHGLEHLLLGSVAEGVVRRAPIPVLLTRGA